MATTKKVALSSASNQTRSKAKASVPTQKKRVSRRSTAKKTTLAVTEKGRASKKIAIRNNTKKTPVTAPSKTPKKTIDTKLAHVESLHANKDKKTQAKKTTNLPMKMPSMQLALLSPYRFPMLTEKGAMALARTSGVFFVIVGALFTLLFSNGFFSNASQMALLGSATGLVPSTVEQVADCTRGAACGLPLAITKPQAQISIDADSGSLSDSVHIKVNVANARSVAISAYSEQRKQEFTLGNATKVSQDSWEMYWNTDQYDDGVYTIKARIANDHGVYETKFGNEVRVHNLTDKSPSDPSAEVVLLDTSEQTADANAQTETKEETVNTPIILTSDVTSSATEIRFVAKAPEAEKVQLFANKHGEERQTAIGVTYGSSDGTWKYRWDLSSVAEGVYTVTAVAFNNGLEYRSSGMTIERTQNGSLLNNTSGVTASTSVTSNASAFVEPVLKPEMSVIVQGGSAASKMTQIRIEAPGIRSAEVYLQPVNTLAQRYLGTAKAADTNVYTFSWDTTKTPNGAYKVVAYVRNAYGTYTAESSITTVTNEAAVARTQEQQQEADTLAVLAKEIVPAVITVKTPATVGVEQALDIASTTGSSTVLQAVSDITEAKPRIDAELKKLTTVLRSQDETAITQTRASIEAIKYEMLADARDDEARASLEAFFSTELQAAVTQVEEEVRRSERVIAERTAQEASKDSDADGITDFDEIALYSTDPYSADTDGDGFTDGSEILAGYDPLDVRAEVLVAYESPKESGVIRDDAFKITGISPAQRNPEEPESLDPAIISGQALPNSFITLYIFSTPVIVTVKTAADGSWTYRLDKELEDGEHQVFVGVTDNSGKIVAKSSPFGFIKEAQAFTAVQAQEDTPDPVVAEEGSLVSAYMIYLVLSISIVAIGLVLILLGIYIDPKQRRREDADPEEIAIAAS